MIIATELREGMALRIEGQICRVIEVESKAGTAKLGGVVKAKLINLRNGHVLEPHFRPQERLEDLELERRVMEFLYVEGDRCVFMRPDTFEQVEIPSAVLGLATHFLKAGMEVPVEFSAGEAVSVAFPEVADARVTVTSPASHAQQDGAWKEAVLDNGLTVLVPLFIGPGDSVRVEVKTGRYLERERAQRKHA
jgi:elongation factor P